jgi:hypothetical protein
LAGSAVNSDATAEIANSAKATNTALAPLRTCGAAERAARFFIRMRSPLYERAAPSPDPVLARAPFAIRTLRFHFNNAKGSQIEDLYISA